MSRSERPRINMAFDEENYRYVKLMSGVYCTDMTRFVNMVIERHREMNAEKYKAAQALKNDGVNSNGRN